MAVDIIEKRSYSVHGIALLEKDNVWLSFSKPWWDVKSWLWWWLTPGQKKIMLIRKNNRVHRVRVVRITKELLRMGVKS